MIVCPVSIPIEIDIEIEIEADPMMDESCIVWGGVSMDLGFVDSEAIPQKSHKSLENGGQLDKSRGHTKLNRAKRRV